MPTLTIYSSVTTDGDISCASGDYETARSGAGTFALHVDSTAIIVGATYTVGPSYTLYEGFLGFDTSALLSSDTVDSVGFSLWPSNDVSVTNFTYEVRALDFGPTITEADWVPGASISGSVLASATTTTTWSTSAYKVFTVFGGFPAAIVKGGSTRLLLSSSRLLAGNVPTTNEYIAVQPSEWTGTTRDPKLTVTYTAGPTAPVWASPADASSTGDSTPTLEFTSMTQATPAHFNIQLDTANTFDTGSLRDARTPSDQTGWEYWDGAAWQAFPATGMPAAKTGNNVRYTPSALASGTWYRRVRQG